MPELPAVVVSRIYGGLGNQLFMYACGLALAQRQGAEFRIDVGRLRDEGQRPYALEVFRLRATRADAATVRAIRGFSDGKLSREWYNLRKSLGLARARGYVREHGFRFAPEVLTRRPPCYLKGHWMSERYFADQAAAVRSDLAFASPPSGRNAELAEAIHAVTAVSVHVRRGDYLAGGNARIYARPGAGYYRRALLALRERVPEFRCFCFSDDPQWARTALDLPADTVFIDHNGNAGHEDLRLMSLCRHHIIANSTFSWWGAWLNPDPDKLVIAPATWYIHPDYDATDLVPDAWLRVAVD